MLKIFIALFSLFFLSACTEAAFGVVNFPSKIDGVTVIKDQPYAQGPLQKLDIYMPESKGDKHPVLIFIHGGRWTEGNKEYYRFLGNAFAEKGYVTVIPDHRKYPEVKFPTFVEDGAAATAWVAKNIAQFRGNTDEIFIAGHSSGAHIGALITADERYLEKHDLNSIEVIKGFAGLAGPYDFEPEAEDLKEMFGPPSNYPQMQVPTFISGEEPPMLLLYGLDDEDVHIRNLRQLQNKIEEQDGQVVVITYENVNHFDILGNLTWIWPTESYVMEDMLDFFTAIIKENRKG
jgi:acetyl esterase/lipase